EHPGDGHPVVVGQVARLVLRAAEGDAARPENFEIAAEVEPLVLHQDAVEVEQDGARPVARRNRGPPTTTGRRGRSPLPPPPPDPRTPPRSRHRSSPKRGGSL